MNKKILIFFTNNEKLSNIKDKNENSLIAPLFQNDSTSIILTEENSKDKLILITDIKNGEPTTKEEAIDELKKTGWSDENMCEFDILCIYHSLPFYIEELSKDLSNFTKKKDYHENDSKYYIYLKDIQKDQKIDNTKFTEIWNKITQDNKLDLALDLLHSCLNIENIDNLTIDSRLKNQFDFIQFKNKIKNTNNDIYIQALSIFRDKLLSSIKI